ncbi:MAG TPA: hemerythrin domain-containing protein [Bacteroidales bacterium]|nr:hemerythrin domain-containing protein [Bacteroidales bacterium]
MIVSTMKMADMIHLNYMLLSVINRLEMKLGFGDATIEDLCRKHNVNTHFFLEIVNTFHDKNYFPQKRMQTFSVLDIIDYLRKTHKFYLNQKLPIIEKMINELIDENQAQKKSLTLLVSFFTEYKQELINHIEREEKKVYPYILEIYNALEAKSKNQELFNKMNAYSIEKYEGEHDNVEEKLFDLKNIIIKYLPPLVDSNICNRILSELFKLEKDLNDHSRIEDKVLVPKVSQMEESFRKLFA